MTSTINSSGRLANQIYRNLAVSMIAYRRNLYCEYNYHDVIHKLGIQLFSGDFIYDNTIELTDDNYFNIYYDVSLRSNLNANNCYFQTKAISNLINYYLHTKAVKENIINTNIFKYRYNTNNDIYIHIRLDDVAKYNPGIDYYLKAISNIEYDNIYISTDEKNHIIIEQLITKYPKSTIINYDEVTTIQFATTCKHIILSHGSFSAVIGMLSYFSNIYYPQYEDGKIWYGDMFSIKGWNKINI